MPARLYCLLPPHSLLQVKVSPLVLLTHRNGEAALVSFSASPTFQSHHTVTAPGAWCGKVTLGTKYLQDVVVALKAKLCL